MLSFDIQIYLDAVSLLKKGPPNIKNEIIDKLNSDAESWEQLEEELKLLLEEEHEDKIENLMNDLTAEDLAPYIMFAVEDISFAYEAAAAQNDLKTLVFNVPYFFNEDAFLENYELSKYKEE